jgi:hypothetical protein
VDGFGFDTGGAPSDVVPKTQLLNEEALSRRAAKKRRAAPSRPAIEGLLLS